LDPELHEHPGLRRALDEFAARILDFDDGGSTPMPEQRGGEDECRL
jgi:hypothetical protein